MATTAGKPEGNHLRIGDVILLYSSVPEEERSSAEREFEGSTGGGYVLADFSGCFPHQLLTVLTEDEDMPKNIEMGAFLVHSANKYNAFKQYNELQRQLNDLEKRLVISTPALDLLKLQVKQAKRDSQVERVENYFRQVRLQGTKVKYGDTVQLQHILSGKYVDVISIETSVTESSKLLVHLEKDDNAGCVFRLHPHTQVEILGNKVNYDDQIKLESVANEFQFLHCSNRSFNEGNLKVFSKDRCEINAAAKGSVFKIEYFRHQNLAHEKADNFVKSNSVVSIFHCPHRANLSAEGSFEYNRVIIPYSNDDVEQNKPTKLTEFPISEPELLPLEPSSSTQKPQLSVQVEVHVDFEERNDPPRESTETRGSPMLHSLESLPVEGGHHSLARCSRSDSVLYGSFDYDSTVTDDVHFNMTTKSGTKTTSPSHFWKIIKNEFRHCGEPLFWNEECRIMHLPTRRYLSVIGSAPTFKLTLKRYMAEEDNSTIFKILPAVQQSTDIVVYQAYMRIQHRDTGTWLHLKREHEFKSNDYHPFKKYEDDDETQAETDLFQVGLTTELNSNDVYTFGMVEPELAAEFNKIADVTAVLANQVQKCSFFEGAFHGSEDECGISYTISSLKHLKDQLSQTSKIAKVRPKIIRSLKTLELATSLLYMHTEDGNFDQDLCAAYFDIIIEFLKGKGIKNKIYVSPMIHHIFTYKVREIDMPESQIVEKALEAVVNDNPTLLYKKDFIKGVVPHLTKQLVNCQKDQTRAIHLLEVLAALCSCNRAPVKDNQEIVLNRLISMHEANKSILSPLRISAEVEVKPKETAVSFDDEGETMQRRRISPTQEIQIDCQHLLGRDGKENWCSLWAVPESIHSFLYAQLKLLWRLCQGNNSMAIQVLKGDYQSASVGVQLNFDIIMVALNDRHLKKYDKKKRYQPRIRALMVKLLQAMYVDVDVCHPFLEKLPFAFKIQDADKPLSAMLEAKSVNMSAMSHISQIKEWIDVFFEDENQLLCKVPEDEYNKMVVRVLQLFSQLVKNGYYSDPKDVYHWINLLMDLLWRQTSSTKDTNSAVSQQQQLSDVVREQWMKGFRGSRRTHFLRGYKRRSDRDTHAISKEKHNLLKVKEWALVVLNLLFNFQLFKGLKMFMHDYCYLSSIDNDEEKVGVDNEIVLHEVTEPKGLDKELKILIHESPTEMVDEPRPRSQEKRITELVKDRINTICHREGSSDGTFDELPNALLELAANMDDGLVLKSLMLLNRHISFESEVLSTALKIELVETKESIKVCEQIEKFQVEMKDYLNGRLSCESTSSPIQVLTGFCYLEDEVGESHQINQGIIIGYGILSDVLKYVLDQCKLLQRSKEDNKKLLECFNLLEGLALNNHEVQLKLLNHVDTFLYAASSEIGSSVGMLLCEIFHGGPSVTLVLRPELAKKILRFMFTKKRKLWQVECISSLAAALQELVVVSELDVPLKHYQLIIMRNCTSMREDVNYWCHDLLLESQKSYREKLLTSEDGANLSLAYLLIITDIFGSCAFGGSSGTGCLCRTVYSKEELIWIICNQSIPLYRRRPFVKFFVWVYMTGEESLESLNILVYKMKRELQIFLKEVDEILKNLCSILQDQSPSSYLNVKKLMKKPIMKYFGEASLRKDTDVLTADMLLYLKDAILPFLQVMYKNQDLSIEKSESLQIYKSLLRLHPIFKDSDRIFFSPMIIRNYYRSTMVVRTYLHGTSSLKIEKNEEVSEVELDILMDKQLLEREYISMARMKYNEIYEHEKKLNERFKKYVHNYKATFEGRNTTESQVVYRTPNAYISDEQEYSEFIDEERNVQGPRFLPLGKYFQDHVQAFRLEESSKNPKMTLARQLEIAGQPKRRILHLNTIDADALTELDIKSLQILRATIYNEFVQIDPEEKERSPETYYQKCAMRLNPLQNEILGLEQTLSKIVLLLTHGNEHIVTEVLAFIDVMLDSANYDLQEKVCDIIAKDENKFFPTILSLLNRAAFIYKESEFLSFLLTKRMNDDGRLIPHHTKDVVTSLKTLPISLHGKRTKRRRRSSGGYSLTRSSTLELLKLESGKRVPFLALHQDSQRSSSLIPVEFRHFMSYEISRVSLICKILGLLCTGQYTKMQDFLRDQHGSIYSINMVGELASFLQQIISGKNFTMDMVELYIEILQSLTEMCVGNVKNSEALFDRNVVSLLNSILQIDITEVGNENAGLPIEASEEHYQILRKNALLLKVASIELLEVMVKKTSCRSQSLVSRVYRGVDMQAIHWSMADFYNLKKDRTLIEMKVDDNAERALFSAYNVCMYFVDSGAATIEELEPKDEKLHEIWDSCATRSRSIEVFYKSQDSNEELLTKVHFNLATKINIADSVKEETWYHIDRSSHGDKMRDFQKWTKAIIKLTQHQDRVKQSKLGVVTKLSSFRYKVLLALTVILNIIVLATFTVPGAGNAQMNSTETEVRIPIDPQLRHETAIRITMWAVGCVHLFFSIWMVIDYFVVRGPFLVLPEWLYNLHLIPKSFEKINFFKKLSKIRVLPKFNHTYASVSIFGFSTLFPIIFLACSVLSLIFKGYFYCICLFYIIVDNDILQRALASVTRNIKSLLWVAVLVLIVIFVYSIITFAFFEQSFDNADNMFCQTLDQCFTSVLRVGLVDNFLDVDVGSQRVAIGRLFFDVTFFILVTTIGLNIVFGIIVDAFSELRDERFRAEQDMKAACFICDIPSYKFDKLQNMGFNLHVKHEHNMWNYVHYLMYLDKYGINNKPIGKYVHDMVVNKSTVYYPFNQALTLEYEEKGEDLREELQQLEETIQDRFTKLEHQFKSLEESITKLDKND